MRDVLAQLVAIGAASISSLGYGLVLGFPTLLIPELSKKDSEVKATLADITWIASLNFLCQPLGAIAGGFISRYLGRRNVLIVSSPPYMIGWLLVYFSGPYVWPLYLSSILLGFTSGFVEGPIQVFTSEICEPRFRGSYSNVISFTIAIGVFLPIFMGTYLYWRTVALYSCLAPLLALITLFCVPESPYWLADNGRIEEAHRALAWLRGWTTKDKVSNEFAYVLNYSQKERSVLKSTFDISRYFRRAALVPFFAVLLTFYLYSFGGSMSSLNYAVPVFRMIDCPIDPYIASYIMGACNVIGCMTSIFSVPWFGKRKPIFTSLFITSLSQFILVIYVFLKEYQYINQEQSIKYSWIPTTCFILSVFGASCGIRPIPWTLAGEYFPGDIRSEGTGISVSTCNVFTAICNKSFIYMINSISLQGTFLFFAMSNFIGLIILYLILPESEGRTLTQLEKYFEEQKSVRVTGSWRNKTKRFVYDNHAHQNDEPVHES